MNQIGRSDVFAVSLPSTIDDTRDIEYYLQVEDTGGPSVVPVSKTRKSLSRNQRLLWGLVGVLVVGVVASQSGGGGSSGGDMPNTIPVNITVNPL